MSRVVFLLEERSMKVLLEGLLPRLFPALPFICIAHEGKRDLEKSLPLKLKAWHEPDARFVVLLDNDGADCLARKQMLVGLCPKGRRKHTQVPIACQELEAWYLGDLDALAKEFGNNRLRGLGAKRRFRYPDAVAQPSRVIEEMIPEFQKVSGARRMASRMRPNLNRSRSFAVLIEAIKRAAADLGAVAPSGGGA